MEKLNMSATIRTFCDRRKDLSDFTKFKDEGYVEKVNREIDPLETIIDETNSCSTWVGVEKNLRTTNDKYNDEHMFESTKSYRTQNLRITIIGEFLLESAKNYGDMFQLTGEYKENEQERKKFEFTLDVQDYVNGKIADRFKQNGIVRLNPQIAPAKMETYLQVLIQQKMETCSSLPTQIGFGKYEGKNVFVGFEFYKKNHYPIKVNRHFDTEIEKEFSQIGQQFMKLAAKTGHPDLIMFLTLIRVTGLLTSLLDSIGIRFPKLLIVKGNAVDIAGCLQIYDRGFRPPELIDLNTSAKSFSSVLELRKDEVILFEDTNRASSYKMKQGIDRMQDLIKQQKQQLALEKLEYPAQCCIISERLSQEAHSDDILYLDMSGLDHKVDKALIDCLYEFDRKIVNRICSEMSDFMNLVKTGYDTGVHIIKKAGAPASIEQTFAILWSVYQIIEAYYKLNISKFLNKPNIAQWVFDTISYSEMYCTNGNRSQEFMMVLNQSIKTGTVALYLHSPLSRGEQSEEKTPPVFVDTSYIYFTEDAFNRIVSQMTMHPTPTMVRKALAEAGELKYVNNSYLSQATLYDQRYAGRQYVTAVRRSVLNEESIKLIRGGIFDYLPCVNSNGSRVLVGIDDRGREVCLSPAHPDLKNKHIEIIGDSGSGKSTAGNLIVCRLHQLGENIIYVDYSNSNSEAKMLSHGISQKFYHQHIRGYDIQKSLDEDVLKLILHHMRDNRIIPVFRFPKYSNEVETFLMLLYDVMVADDSLSATLVIDEVHELNYGAGSALCHIMEKGRGNGISLISILQAPHELKPQQLSRLNQSSVKLVFGLNDGDDAEACVKKMGLKPCCKFVELVGGMPKRSCLVVGELEDRYGILSPKRYTRVKLPDICKKNEALHKSPKKPSVQTAEKA